MESPPGALPRIDRPDAGLVLVGEWTVGTPERQRLAAEAALGAWDQVAWPRGLLAHAVLPSTDGTTLLHYSQWTGGEAHEEFVRTDPPARVQGILAAVPGVERHGVTAYRRLRSTPAADAGPTPGCVVAISVEVDGPEVARRWIDAVFAAMRDEPSPHPGGIAAHFHVGTDGTRVLNYAEWASEEAHRAFVRDVDGPAWRRVREMPGVRHPWERAEEISEFTRPGFRRYDARRSRTRSAPTAG